MLRPVLISTGEYFVDLGEVKLMSHSHNFSETNAAVCLSEAFDQTVCFKFWLESVLGNPNIGLMFKFWNMGDGSKKWLKYCAWGCIMPSQLKLKG